MLVAAALAGFWFTRGTPYHQFALGVLLSSVSLLVLLFLVEVIWQTLAPISGAGQSDTTDRHSQQ
jgi:hypothetical protein